MGAHESYDSSRIATELLHHFQQIAEESAQGSGQHLEALASLSGCSAEQYGTFEAAMNRNHRYVFAGKDYDGSVNNFFNVLNTDEDLLKCWSQS